MHLDMKLTYHLDLSATEYRLVQRSLRGEPPRDDEEAAARRALADQMFDQRGKRIDSMADMMSKKKE